MYSTPSVRTVELVLVVVYTRRGGRLTAIIELTDAISKEDILDNLKRIPPNPKYLDHRYNQYTYPIQDANTRTMIKNQKADLAPEV